jgi:hypothetical protein
LILADVTVIAISLRRIHQFFKDQPLLQANERYMAVHIVLLSLLCLGNVA